MPTITIAYFAAARAAAGRSEAVVDIPDPATIASALAAGAPEGRTPDYGAVVARCSFLVNGVASTDPTSSLRDGDRVDVLPPFAGG